MTYRPSGRVCDRCGSAPIIKEGERLCPGGGTCKGTSERHPDSPHPLAVSQPKGGAKK